MTTEIQEFFKTLNDHTRTTYYVLPLISLNKFSFGSPENFINAYLSQDHKQIIVLVNSTALVYPNTWEHEYLVHHTKDYMVFDLPDEFKEDINLFLKGKYSKLSETAKDLIKLNSGLNYKEENIHTDGSKGLLTDFRIGALDKDPHSKVILEELLGVILDEDAEFISPPGQDEIWKTRETVPS